jgi:hypothetical protein
MDAQVASLINCERDALALAGPAAGDVVVAGRSRAIARS